MPPIAAVVVAGVRQAEPWSFFNILGGLFLIAAFTVLLVWLVRRYLGG
ncbi:MAG: hypothetical protein ABWY62_02955 [Acidimicrobiia bacterium]